MDDIWAKIQRLNVPYGATQAFPEAQVDSNYPFSSDPQGEARRQALILEYLARLQQGQGREDPLNDWLGKLFFHNQQNPIMDNGLSGGLNPMSINALMPQKNKNMLIGI